MKLGGWLLIASCLIEIVGLVVLLNGGGWALMAIGIFFFVGSMIINSNQSKQEKISDLSSLKEKLNELPDFSPTHQLFSHDNKILISIDDKTDRMVYTKRNLNTVVYFKDIIESEVVIDDVTVSKVSRSGQLASAAIGGVLAGGVGAIIGGLSSSSTSDKRVNKITLKIVINDLSNPNIIVTLLDSDVELKRDSYQVTTVLENAHKWESMMRIIVKNNSKDSDIELLPPLKGSSIADEINKLANLFKEGLITENEFVEGKQKLLN